MKRLYIVLTILLSSFLVYVGGGERVKAYSLSMSVDFDLINDTFYIIKNKADEFVSASSTVDYYVIYYIGSAYRVGILSNSSCVINNTCYFNVYSDNNFRLEISTFKIYKLRDDSLVFESNNTSGVIFYLPLYANFSFRLYGANSNATFTYSDKEWNFYQGDIIFTVYDMFQDYNNQLSPTPVDNTPILTNFYTTVIEKINYLCGVIVSNYIYLSVLVIFILIILFELIFRRRL